MLIYDALKKDHDKVKELLATLVTSSQADEDTRTSLIQKIRDELVPHARAEEAVFYNSLRSIEPAKDLVKNAYGEHLEAESLLRTLQGMEAADMNWKKTALKLKEAVEHHIREEEGSVFSAAKQLLIEEEARMMGEAFERMKPEIREGSFVQNTVEMVANMMPERFAKPLRSFIYRPN